MLSSKQILLLVLVVTVLRVGVHVQGFPITPSDPQDNIQICGKRIWMELRKLCPGHFYNPHDDENSTTHDPPVMSMASIVSTCCKQPCTVRHLYKFCSKEWRARAIHETSLDQPIGTEPSIVNDPAPFILDWMIYDTRTGRLVRERDPAWWNALVQAPNLIDGTPKTIVTYHASSEETQAQVVAVVDDMTDCNNKDRHLTTSRRGCMKTEPPVDNSYVAINPANERSYTP